MESQNNLGSPSRKILTLTEEEREIALYNRQYAGIIDDVDEEGIDLREYWRIIMRHKFTVLLVIVIVIVSTAIYTSMQTPIYRSSAKIQIDPQSTQVMHYETVTSEESYGSDYMATQYELLKSKKLARRVVQDLGLTSSKQFMGEEKPSFFKGVEKSIRSFLFDNEQERAGVANEQPGGETGRLGDLLVDGLSINPIKSSRIVAVSFDSPNPVLAAKLVNTLVESFITMNLERRFEASSYAKIFLEERTKQVRANLEDSEQKLIEYADDREIIDFEHKHSGLMEKIRMLNSNLVAVEARRIQTQSVFDEMQIGGIHGFTRVMDNAVVQTYKQSLAALEAKYEENLKIYKPAYPAMVQLKVNIDKLSTKISIEINNIKMAVKSDYKAALREEAILKSNISELKNQILELQAGSTEFQVLKRDVDTNRELYDGLLQRMKEVDVTAGIGNNNISILDSAEVPGLAYKPKWRKNLMLALVLGSFGGIGLAFLFDHLDDTIKSSDDMEKLTGLSTLGIIPEVDLQHESAESIAMVTFENPTSSLSEAYRSLRTALTFSTISGSPDVLLVTSCSAGEGKTTTAISLATTYTQTGSNVLLIDADLRDPSLHKELNLPNELGLTNCLTGVDNPGKIIQRTYIPKLWALTSGPTPPNPVELLASGNMMELVNTAAKKFDMVILDCSPVLGLADALVLANMAQAVLLVVDTGATRTGSVVATMQRFRQIRANIIGAVLTKYGQGGSGHDYYYSYDYYGYGRDETGSKRNKQQAHQETAV